MNNLNTWVHTKHCSYWCPGVKAPCHQHLQNFCCILYRNITSIWNDIRTKSILWKRPSYLRVKGPNRSPLIMSTEMVSSSALLFTGVVQGKLQHLQWLPVLSPWQPLRFCVQYNCCRVSIKQWAIIGSNNGLVLTSQQAITWNNDPGLRCLMDHIY